MKIIKQDREAFTALMYLLDQVNRDNIPENKEECDVLLRKTKQLINATKNPGKFVIGDKSYNVSQDFKDAAINLIRAMYDYKKCKHSAGQNNKNQEEVVA